jgi:type I restriction enzyme S subunit
MPYGWTKRPISSFGKVVTGKTPSTSKSEYYGGSIPFVKIPDMHGVVFPIVTETTLSGEGAESQSNKFVPKNSIMVSCIATVGLVNIAVERCQTNQQINTLILNNEENLYYIYQSLKRIKELLEGVGSNGATMTNVNKAKFEKLELLYPNQLLVKKFDSYCSPIFEKILGLTVAIQRLQEARDRLLPKLMSGEIEL